MAVYDRQYRPYDGPVTPRGRRWLAISRAALSEVLESRLYLLSLVACFVPPLVVGLLIYLRHNMGALVQLDLRLEDLIVVDARLFVQLLASQTALTYILALLIGPALLSADLADGALPVILCRPVRRAEYLLGKAALLVALLSATTWIPGLVLIALQTSLEGRGWLEANVRLVPGLVASSLVWVGLLTLLVLAVSALVRRRLPARVLLLALFYVPAAFGTAVNGVLDTRWGSLFGLNSVIQIVWRSLFAVPSRAGEGGLFGVTAAGPPAWSAWLVLAVVCLGCLAILHVRVRPFTVVRS